MVVNATGAVPSEDGLYHLVASSANQTAPAGDDLVQQASNAVFTVPLNLGTTNSMIYRKFTVCVVSGGALVPVSNSMFILNPEACAVASPARMDNGIKGIFPEMDNAIAAKNQVVDLGISQVNINVPISKVATLGVYDHLVMKYNSLGIQVNMIILPDKAAGATYIHPSSYYKDGHSHSLYAFNTSSPESLQALGDAAAIMASRYANVGFGQVDNFIIGNEVNAWREWYYLKYSSNAQIVSEYYKAFRVMYNGIKAVNANANVYTCVDHQWATPEASYYMSSKEFLTTFNTCVLSEGNVDWRVAVHPNNYWLLATKAWELSSKVKHDQSSPYVTMANFEILTDFLSLPEMLSPTGQVRSVKISELGYSSHKGQKDQAASVVFAYLMASNNSHVDGIVIHREADTKTEIKQGIYGGLCGVDGSQKIAYSFYKNPLDPQIIAQASSYAGVDLTSLIVAR